MIVFPTQIFLSFYIGLLSEKWHFHNVVQSNRFSVGEYQPQPILLNDDSTVFDFKESNCSSKQFPKVFLITVDVWNLNFCLLGFSNTKVYKSKQKCPDFRQLTKVSEIWTVGNRTVIECLKYILALFQPFLLSSLPLCCGGLTHFFVGLFLSWPGGNLQLTLFLCGGL